MKYCLTMRLDYHKLVRDQIPEIIEANGERPVTRILSKDELLPALLCKLAEEAAEANAAAPADLPAELADVLEVLMALAAELGLAWTDLVALAAEKRGKRGGFERAIFLEYVEEHL